MAIMVISDDTRPKENRRRNGALHGDFLANRPFFGRDSLVRKNDGYYGD